jgi:hypothetical protein
VTGAAVLTVLAGLLAAWVWHRLSQSWLVRVLWNWFTGLPLDDRGKRKRDQSHRKWTRRRHCAVRNGSMFAVFGTFYGLFAARAVTLGVLAAAALAGATFGAWRGYRAVRWWAHRWRYERPTRRVLTRELEAPPPRLAIEPDRSRVRIWLPEDFGGSPREREAVERVVAVKVAPEMEPDWESLRGAKPLVTFTKSEPPPPKVASRHILPAIEAAAEHVVILGIGKKDQVIDVSLDTESPHLGFCMTTGDGKSAAAANASVQILYHGGLVIMLDYKLMSHMWARGLPNVAYAGTPSELHAMLCWLANDDERESELTRRKQVALASADIRGNVTADIGPRILVVAEELNVTQRILKSYWRKTGGKGPSPAAEALDEVLFTGRQLRVHALQIGQRLSAKATSGSGSADSRENLGAIVFSDPSDSTWRMLTDGHVKPPASGHKGRYQVVTRKQVREMQGALWDEEDCRAFATAGTVAIPRADMPFVTHRVPAVVGQTAASAIEAPDQGKVVQHEALPPLRDPGTVTLKEAVEAGMWPTIHAARQAKQRHKPTPVGTIGSADLFRIEDLAACRIRKRP